MDFATLLALEPHGPDTFVGTGPSYPWGGLYGGQIVAQSLRAASLTVDPAYRVHSLHAYFIRRGDATEPIRFEVDRIRNGRSFVTRRVLARQTVGAILSMSASFCLDEEGPDVQTAVMPAVPPPDDLVSDSWTDVFTRRWVPGGHQGGRAVGWLRMRQPVPDDAAAHAVALAYLSDDLPTDAVASLHPAVQAGTVDPEDGSEFFRTSLDHAIWFHRPSRADEWHLHELSCHGLIGTRGVSIGHVFTADGTHVATVTQEVLFRGTPRP